MADELNIPTHRWYQKRNHVALAKEDVSRQYIYDSGIQKIDAWINSQPWGDVYIVNRLSPNLVFDFDESYFRTEGTATDLVSAATHTRATSATYVDANGILQTAAINEPRVGHHIWNGSAWVDEGYLHESEARTNLLLNSDTLATQSVTVTAVPHTLHFTGTGTVTLTGASTAGPLVGTGTGEQNRVSLTFTPTAGTLVVTVTGTVTNADLEVGSTLSSHKPTAGATVTRAADAMTIPAANLPWPEPVVIGPELVTDTFTDASEGTGSASESGGSITVYGPDNDNQGIGTLELASTLEVGKTYLLSVTIESNSNEVGVACADTSFAGVNTNGFIREDAGATGEFTAVVYSKGNENCVIVYTLTDTTATVGNISVRELSPARVSIQMEGTMTYANSNTAFELTWLRWVKNSFNYILQRLSTSSPGTGEVVFIQRTSGTPQKTVSSAIDAYTPGINVPFNTASRHGSTFINGAVDGTALTADLTPAPLPDLSSSDMQIGFVFNGTIKLFRVWADDLTDEGISEASSNA